jgi:hypothetical protein
MSKEFNEALQTCLDLIRSGGETLDSVVARYPEFTEDLRAQLEVAVWLSSSRAMLDPSPEFVSSSKHRLISKIKHEQQAIPTPLTWVEQIQEFFTIQKLAPVGFVVVLLLALVVSGTVVSASRKSLPGDNLYSLKRTLEQFALATSLEEQNDAELYIQFVGNRLFEAQALIIVGSYEEVAETLQDMEEQVDETWDIIDVISEEDKFLALDLAMQLDKLLAEQSAFLNDLTENLPYLLAAQIYRVGSVSEIVRLAAQEFAVFVPPPPTPTALPTRAPTRTPRPTPTAAPTQQPIQPSPTVVEPTKKPDKPTDTPLPTNTPLPTETPIPTNTPTLVPTDTPTNTPTDVPTPTDTPTDVPTPTNTPSPTDTPTDVPADTPTPTDVPTSTPNP